MVITDSTADWLALAIGNSRLHWSWFRGDHLQVAWDTRHLDAAESQWLTLTQFDFQRYQLAPASIPLPRWTQQTIPLRIASVVPRRTAFWQQYGAAQVITLADVPLLNCYPTLGVDRALTLWGAMQTYGVPVLVIDGGTAMTFTGADAVHKLVGGAIFPGIRALFQTLNQATAGLPRLDQSVELPPVWAMDTDNAIRSGIVHMVTAGLTQFVEDWLSHHPQSTIVFTGGDGQQLYDWYQSAIGPDSNTAAQIIWDAQLIFAGMQAVVRRDYPTADKS
ncbi:pantothenate kinase [filamentous cyanobacterium LEGE 11480]|uniref:Type III pantothenate kinase n=2 Tax=Romeriopsis TaxID=2992131 RepID=A0A928VRZ2_9CYAN|nr:pantothenate kinase [Romeriopsis navalis LEGE 11480]